MGSESRGFIRSRLYQSYFGMNLTSATAGSVASVAIIWVVFAMTKSAIDIAIIGVTQTLTSIAATLPTGVWVDRYNRRALLLAANAVSAASIGCLALITAEYGFHFVAIIAAAIAWSVASELYRSTNYSVLPDIVKAEQIADANGVTQAGSSLTSSVSNALGGAIVAAAGAAVAFSYGFAAFSIAAVFSFLLFARAPPRASAAQERPRERRMGQEVKEGFRWLITQRGLFELSVSAMVFNFIFGMANYFMVVYVAVALAGGAVLFGIILAAYVIGNATGSLLVGKTGALRHAGKAWVLLYGGAVGLLTLFMGLFPIAPLAVTASLLIGLAAGFSGNVWLSSAQGLVPSDMRGRYFAIDGLLSFIGGPPAIAGGGILITVIGVAKVYQLTGILLVISAVVFASMKSLWALDGRMKGQGLSTNAA